MFQLISDSQDPRPTRLRLWLAFGVAVLVYRFVARVIELVFVFFVSRMHADSWEETPVIDFLLIWEETITIVISACLAVTVERWQELCFVKKSTRTNVILAVLITFLALNPLHVDIDTELVSFGTPAVDQHGHRT